MTLEQAKIEATRSGDRSGMMRIVYKSTLHEGEDAYGVAATLPTFGVRIGNYYPGNYVRPGWFEKGKGGN